MPIHGILTAVATSASTLLFAFLAKGQEPGPASSGPSPLLNRQEGDFVIRNYKFRSGEMLPEVRLHYTTAGTPIRDAGGKIRNGVLIMHGSTNDASQVLAPPFTAALTGAGQPLDAAKHFLIFPDILGAGKSSKPSDGLRARFPKYGYQDLVDLEHRLITEHFGIDHLRLVMGVSMGGMHTWLWAERYPEMMDAAVPLSSFPTKIDGRNLLWRRILSNAVRTDPSWKGGDYTEQPSGFLNIMPMFDMMISSTAGLGERLHNVEEADAYVRGYIAPLQKNSDANNVLYRFESSFDYDPGPELGKISCPLLTILFEDDELNTIQLGVIQREMPKVPSGRLVIIPASPMSQGHRGQVQAALYREHLAAFLASLPPIPAGAGR